jgi:SAM-dependent methyltransferase
LLAVTTNNGIPMNKAVAPQTDELVPSGDGRATNRRQKSRELGRANIQAYPDVRYPEFQARRQAQWNDTIQKRASGFSLNAYYHQRLTDIFQLSISPGQTVLEIGCGNGDLLAAVKPAVGVGVDFSTEAVKLGSKKHPSLRFIEADAHSFDVNETFDVVILSDLINDVWDVQTIFRNVARVSSRRTRVIVNFFSLLWKAPLMTVRRLGFATPLDSQNWLTVQDVENLFALAGFEVVQQWDEILCPLKIPFVAAASNKYLIRFWPFSIGALTHFVVAKPVAASDVELDVDEPLVSVVIAARNEAGNIEQIFQRVPEMGAGSELIFVEGGSEDDTFEVIENAISRHPERNAKLFRQTGKGKGDAVRLGFAEARGDVLMILDADLTVQPEDLPRFLEALVEDKGEFINGVRLVYPMNDRAMAFFNLVGNKFFSVAFSWLLGQEIKDTLCGTKVVRKADYEMIAANRSYFGEFDPFGDFDLIFGAAKLKLKITDLPVRYGARTYGETNINRWSHGWMLLRMLVFAASRIKFI